MFNRIWVISSKKHGAYVGDPAKGEGLPYTLLKRSALHFPNQSEADRYIRDHLSNSRNYVAISVPFNE